MIDTLTLDYRKLLAWGAVLALALLILGVLLGPLLAQNRELDAEIARDRQVLDRLTRLDVSRDRIQEAAKRFSEEELASLVYSQDTPAAQIALDVQKRVTEILDKSGAEVKTVAAYNVPAEEFQGTGIKITFTGPMEAVATALHEIESAPPLLVIEELDIKPLLQGRLRRGQEEAAAPPAQAVQVQLAVVAYTPLAESSGK
jgi:general secretion pathway protein M